MVLLVIATTLGYDVEVVMSTRPYLTGTDKSAVERIILIVHLVHAEYSFKAVLVESFVVSD